MGRSKIETFIGFCIKSGAIEAVKERVYIIILSGEAAVNTRKLAVKYSDRFHCPLVICKSGFEEVVNRAGCKIAAVRDKNLAKAILENLDNNYELYCGGNF